MPEPTLTPQKPLKLATGKSALALVQAEAVRAALKRLKRENLITGPLESAIMLSAAGQGAIAIDRNDATH